MSGGSYDYVYGLIRDIEIRDIENNPDRAAFQKLLKLVANAMHDIEWVDSGDNGEGEELKAIRKCFKFLTPDDDKILKSAKYDLLKSRLKKIVEVME